MRRRTLGTIGALAIAMVTMGLVMAAQDEEHPIAALVAKELKDPSKPFVMLVHLKAKPGQGDALEAAFVPAVAATRKEKGCRAYSLSRKAGVEDTYVLYEHWDNLDDLKAHLAALHITTLLGKLDPLNAEPPRAEIWVPVAE